MKHVQVVLGAAAVFVTACGSGGSLSSFRGAPFPVMLGEKRLGPAAPVTKVDDWYAEAVNFASSVDAGSYRITTVRTAPTSYMAASSTRYVSNNVSGDVDLQVTTLKGTAYVTAFGGAAKEIMRVDADIMKSAGAQPAGTQQGGGK